MYMKIVQEIVFVYVVKYSLVLGLDNMNRYFYLLNVKQQVYVLDCFKVMQDV